MTQPTTVRKFEDIPKR